MITEKQEEEYWMKKNAGASANNAKKINRANQLINEKAEVQKDGTLRISSEDWKGINQKLNEGNKVKSHVFEDAIRQIAMEANVTVHYPMKEFYQVIYQFDTEKYSKTSRISLMKGYDGEIPEPRTLLTLSPILQYAECFEKHEESIAYKKMQQFERLKYKEALNMYFPKRDSRNPNESKSPPLERRNINSKENFMSDEFREEARFEDPEYEDRIEDPKALDLFNQERETYYAEKAAYETGFEEEDRFEDPEYEDYLDSEEPDEQFYDEKSEYNDRKKEYEDKINSYHAAYEERKAAYQEAKKLAARNPNQSESPPLERRNINSKENFMSEQQNTEAWTFRPPVDAAAEAAKQEAYIHMRHQRKMVLEGLKNGTLSCLPGEDGFADTQPAVKLVKGEYYHGTNLLDLKDHQKKNGFPTAEYVTEDQINSAKKDYPDLSLRKEEKGVFLNWEDKNKETGEWERKSVVVFNIAQTTNPEVMKAYADQKQQEEYQKYVNYKREAFPGWEPPEPKQKMLGPVIECSSTDPEKYLGQYFAAVSMGGKFKVSEEQAAEFSQKMDSELQTLVKIKDKELPDLFRLSKISNEASTYCKDVIRVARMEENREQYKEQQQHQEQTQSRGGRGM